MKTEIIKIIEGGLSGDREKVFNYSQVLANNYKKLGDEAFSDRLLNTLTKKRTSLVNYDEFSTKPVDQESRIDIIDIWYPNSEKVNIIMNKYTQSEIDAFILQYEKRDQIVLSGLDYSSTLLLYGFPGCGKTTLAKYIASKMNMPLIIARFDALVSSMLGSTAKNIRKVFEYARKRECILFLDEFDVIAKARDDSNELGELKRVVNSLLQNIDLLRAENVIIAATNHHDLLDKAVWRRFDKVIELKKPSSFEIEMYINQLLKGIKTDFMEKTSKKDDIIYQLNDMSYSNIKTIMNNSLKKKIVSENEYLDFTSVIYEVYLFKNHNMEDESDLVQFLNANGVSQDEISKKFSIPIRTVRKFLNLEEKYAE